MEEPIAEPDPKPDCPSPAQLEAIDTLLGPEGGSIMWCKKGEIAPRWAGRHVDGLDNLILIAIFRAGLEQLVIDLGETLGFDPIRAEVGVAQIQADIKLKLQEGFHSHILIRENSTENESQL